MTPPPLPPRRRRLNARWTVGLVIALAAAASFVALEVGMGDLVPTRGGLALARRFLGRAFSPALGYESEVPAHTPPLVWKALGAAHATVLFASAAMSLAVVAGAVLAFFASSAWWSEGGASGSGERRAVRPAWWVPRAAYGGARVLAALLRSVHELLWAVLLLAAFGLGQLTAVMAIAVPYCGILAKVFSEMIDEAPRDAAMALREAGASPLQVFFVGLLPRALPDMAAYAFYRFECAVRSSAILGFFGFPTLGYYVAASFENFHFGEVWTYLYVLFALVAVLDWWSGALRRRLVA